MCVCVGIKLLLAAGHVDGGERDGRGLEDDGFGGAEGFGIGGGDGSAFDGDIDGEEGELAEALVLLHAFASGEGEEAEGDDEAFHGGMNGCSDGLLDSCFFAADAVVTSCGPNDEATDAGERGGQPLPAGGQNSGRCLTGGDEDAAKCCFPRCFFHGDGWVVSKTGWKAYATAVCRNRRQTAAGCGNRRRCAIRGRL